jgi:hypothetical protein
MQVLDSEKEPSDQFNNENIRPPSISADQSSNESEITEVEAEFSIEKVPKYKTVVQRLLEDQKRR